MKSVHKKFGDKKRGNFPIVSFFDLFIRYPHILKMQVLAPLNYIDYSKKEAIEILERKYGWRYYGGKHYESRWTRFFQAYYLPHKFGYDKRKAHFSSMILAGEMTRDQGIEELKQPLYDPALLEEDKSFISKKLGITVADFDEYLSQPVSSWTEFSNHQQKIIRSRKIIDLVKKYW